MRRFQETVRMPGNLPNIIVNCSSNCCDPLDQPVFLTALSVAMGILSETFEPDRSTVKGKMNMSTINPESIVAFSKL